MFTEPGRHAVACLRLIWDEPSVQDHCMGRGWLAFDSYEVPHVYKVRNTYGRLPSTHLGQSVCLKTLHGQKVVGL